MRDKKEPTMNDTATPYEPCLPDTGCESTRPAQPVASTESPPPVYVLVIDNESTHAMTVKAMLQREGYTVVVTTRSVEAVELFRAAPERYGIVVTDAALSDMGGTDIVQALRAIRPSVPIIMGTDFCHQVAGGRGLPSGVDAVLIKPISEAALTSTLARILTERAREKPEAEPGG